MRLLGLGAASYTEQWMFTYLKLPIAVAYWAGVLPLLPKLVSLTEDTTVLTSTAFAASITMAGVSFGLARTIGEDAGHKEEVLAAGHRGFHAAVMIAAATILKYTAIQGASLLGLALRWEGTGLLIQLIIASLFAGAAYSGYVAVWGLDGILRAMIYRRPQG